MNDIPIPQNCNILGVLCKESEKKTKYIFLLYHASFFLKC